MRASARPSSGIATRRSSWTPAAPHSRESAANPDRLRYELAVARDLLTRRRRGASTSTRMSRRSTSCWAPHDFGDLVGQMDHDAPCRAQRRGPGAHRPSCAEGARRQSVDAGADDMRTAEKLVAQREREYATIRAELGQPPRPARRRAARTSAPLVRERRKAAAAKSATVRPPTADPGGGPASGGRSSSRPPPPTG